MPTAPPFLLCGVQGSSAERREFWARGLASRSSTCGRRVDSSPTLSPAEAIVHQRTVLWVYDLLRHPVFSRQAPASAGKLTLKLSSRLRRSSVYPTRLVQTSFCAHPRRSQEGTASAGRILSDFIERSSVRRTEGKSGRRTGRQRVSEFPARAVPTKNRPPPHPHLPSDRPSFRTALQVRDLPALLCSSHRARRWAGLLLEPKEPCRGTTRMRALRGNMR